MFNKIHIKVLVHILKEKVTIPLDFFSIKLKFIYSEKATKFCEIFTLLLTICMMMIESKVKISQNFVSFSEYMNFNAKEAL